MEIDNLNINIIRALRNGRKSFKAIADELEVTENTIRNRVKKLTDEGILEISGNVNVDAFKGHRVLYLGVKLNNMELQKKGEEFISLRGVISAAIVTGRYDFILQVPLRDDYNLLEFITGELSKIDGVQTVESFVVYKGFDLKVPYNL